MDKPGGFIGREALLAAGPPRRRLVPLLLADPEPQLYHGESVLQDGRVVGRVTSGAYGHTLGAAVGLAALDGEPGAVDEVVAARRRGGRDRRRARAGARERAPLLRSGRAAPARRLTLRPAAVAAGRSAGARRSARSQAERRRMCRMSGCYRRDVGLRPAPA